VVDLGSEKWKIGRSDFLRKSFSEGLTLRPLQRRGDRSCKLKSLHYLKPLILGKLYFSFYVNVPLSSGEGLGVRPD
jgi:hypothetical protein